MKKVQYKLNVFSGRVKVYYDGYVMFTFSINDFKGYYAHKDDKGLYGIDIYLTGNIIMKIIFENEDVWLNVLKLLDNEL